MTQGALYRIILPCLAVLGLPGFHAWGQSAESLARRGNLLYQQGNVEESIDAYSQALIRKPDNSLFQYNLGTALAKGGHAGEAAQKLRQAAEAPGTPRGRDAYYNMGVALGEEAKKMPEAAAAPGLANPAPGGGAATPPPAGGPPQGPQQGANPLEQKIKMLEQSLGALRSSILATSPKDGEDLDNSRYNYETVMDMLRQARAQLKQDERQQNKDGKGKNGKDPQNQQNQQNQQQKQDQNSQEPKNGQQQPEPKNGPQNQDRQQQPNGQQNGGKEPQPTPRPQNSQGRQKGDASKAGDPQDGQQQQLTPEQQDALALLNMLEGEKPDQFKQIFRFRSDTPKHLEQDW